MLNVQIIPLISVNSDTFARQNRRSIAFET